MSTHKPRLTRLTAILTQLQSRRLVTARALADRHGVSIRTVYRDIRTLEQSGVPILTEEGKGYSLMEGYQLPPVLFTQEEANALITAEQFIKRNSDQSLIDAYQLAIEKIRSVLGQGAQEKAELLEQRMQVRSTHNPGATSNYLIPVQAAISDHRLVHLTYCSLQGERTERVVEPFSLINTNNHWIMVAFCQLRNSFRAFRLDCFEGLSTSNETFTPHALTLEQYFEQCREKSSNP